MSHVYPKALFFLLGLKLCISISSHLLIMSFKSSVSSLISWLLIFQFLRVVWQALQLQLSNCPFLPETVRWPCTPSTSLSWNYPSSPFHVHFQLRVEIQKAEMNQQPLFNAPKNTRNNSLCSVVCWAQLTDMRLQQLHPLRDTHPPSASQSPGPGVWSSVAKRAAALPRLGGVRDRQGFPPASARLHFFFSFPSGLLAKLTQSNFRPNTKAKVTAFAVVELCEGRLKLTLIDRLEMEAEDATLAPRGQENTAMLTSWDFLGRGRHDQLGGSGSCGLRENRSQWLWFLLGLGVGLGLHGLNFMWALREG